MIAAAVYLDIQEAYDTTWHSGLRYKLFKLEVSTTLIKLIGPFLSQRKYNVLVEGKMSTLREIQEGVPQGSVLYPRSPTLALTSPL
jgi:hypothetical protein